MDRLARITMIAITSAALATALVIAFLWVGPGVGASEDNDFPPVLFDEEQITSLYRRASPAVVEVRMTRGVDDFPFRDSTGSGFLIDTEGHIVTNDHVVDDATSVWIEFMDGRMIVAEVLGHHPANDLALLKIDPAEVEGIEPLELGDSSQVEPGQLAIAIGNPYGLEGSVTAGIISGVNRDLPSELNRPISGVIQTDAPIFPGNSGGPLLDSDGLVVGINTAIQVSPTGDMGQSIGFAVPVDTLKEVLPRLKTEGLVLPPWLGISGTDIDERLAEQLDLPISQGVYITEVFPDSPAQEAGLVESSAGAQDQPASGGDVITEIDGVPLRSLTELVGQINGHAPGDGVVLTLRRGDDILSVEVTLGEWPPDLLEGRLPRPDRFHDEFPFEPFPRFGPPGYDED